MRLTTLFTVALTLGASTSTAAQPMSNTMEELLAGIDTIATGGQLIMLFDNPVEELESVAESVAAPLYHRIRATSFLSTLTKDGGREALMRLSQNEHPEIRRHAVYSFLRSTNGNLTQAEWDRVVIMLENDHVAIRQDIVRGFRWSRDARAATRLESLARVDGPLQSLAARVAKRRAVLMRSIQRTSLKLEQQLEWP